MALLKNAILIAAFIAGFKTIYAQDSSKVIRLADFLKLVEETHPMFQQTSYMQQSAKSEIGMARGSFDPKYDFDYTQKIFKGTTYYEYLDHGLKIPTWIGVDVKAGFEKNSGLFVNPTNYTPAGGLMYLGLDIPVGKGLWMDERRAMLRQAQAAASMTNAEQQKLQIKFRAMAIKDYMEWALLIEKLRLSQKALRLSEARYEGVRQRVEGGDLPTIDSVEALTQLIERKNELLMTETALQQQQNRMELYFWSPDGVPLEMEGALTPVWEKDALAFPEVATLKDSLNMQHPDLIKLRAKITHYKIEQSWRRNELLPAFVLTTKYLNTPDHNISGDFTGSYLRNNYKIQLGIAQPLFLRKEVNKMQLATIKLNMVKNDLSMTNRELQTELDNMILSANAMNALNEQQAKNVKMYLQLAEGEQTRFAAGESSMFLVNSRENKWIESASKELDTRIKYQKSLLDLYIAAGMNPKLK